MLKAISKTGLILCILTSVSFGATTIKTSGDDSESLAKELTNPVADLISVPFQFNYNDHLNPELTGHQTYVNIQPVIPIHLNPQWNLISRTILPVTDQLNVLPHSGTQFGLGDTLQSLFLSPAAPVDGLVWGIGPAISVPTGTQHLLGAGKLSIGPTVVALKMTGPWTVGVLSNQIWSVAGSGGRKPVSQWFVQPFLAYTTKSAWTYTLNSESYYYWHNTELSAPINLMVAKLIHVGHLPISIGGGLRYWATKPDAGPRDFGVRLIVTLLFPA